MGEVCPCGAKVRKYATSGKPLPVRRRKHLPGGAVVQQVRCQKCGNWLYCSDIHVPSELEQKKKKKKKIFNK